MTINPLNMSDEDFLKLGGPTETEEEVKPEVEEETTEEEVVPETQEETVVTEEEVVTDPEEKPEEVTTEVDEPVAVKDKQEPKAEVPPKEKTEPEVKTTTEEVDYKGFFDKVMAPFQANGKKIELKDPSEVIQLMQMGANYTAKMQQLAPHRKVLMMLQNNQLLDEGKLAYLIDLDKKNPEAIKKLLKESGIDPMDIDATVEPAYQEGNHRISDKEANFQDALNELMLSDSGKETVQVITGWDQASKDLLWDNPQAMTHIRQQREAGMYDRIAAEVDRLKRLGTIPLTVPFIQAYMQVGDQLNASGAFADLAPKPEPVKPTPVATRVVAPKPPVSNGSKATAAAQTKVTSQPAKVTVNPLSMSDDEFLKQFANRV